VSKEGLSGKKQDEPQKENSSPLTVFSGGGGNVIKKRRLAQTKRIFFAKKRSQHKGSTDISQDQYLNTSNVGGLSNRDQRRRKT